MGRDSCDVSTALVTLGDSKNRLPQGPVSSRAEEAKVEFLYEFLTGTGWSKPALAQLHKH